MKTLIPLFLAFLFALPASAGSRSFRDWLKDLDARLRRADKRYSRLAAAASVRGAKAEETPKLYWKGREEYRAVTKEELDAFKASVALAREGKEAEARAGLEAFLAAYPGGPLEADAKETLSFLPAPDVPPAEATGQEGQAPSGSPPSAGAPPEVSGN